MLLTNLSRSELLTGEDRSDLTKSESAFSNTILLGKDSTCRDLDSEVELTVGSTVGVDTVVEVGKTEVVEIVLGTIASSGKI